MHSNLIAEIEKSGSLKEWSKAADDSCLTRSFEFGNPRSATVFMNEISKWCSENDHHPEWSLKGNMLNVRLTSHFNNNHVSILDFKLAKHMSETYIRLGSKRPYRYWSKTDAVEWTVGAFIVSCLVLHYYYCRRFDQIDDVPSVRNQNFLFTSRRTNDQRAFDHILNFKPK